jgi:hypothetical protein
VIELFTIRYSEAFNDLVIELVTFFFDYSISSPKFRILTRIEHYKPQFLVNRGVLHARKTARFARLTEIWGAMSPPEVASVDNTDYSGCVDKLKTSNTHKTK